MVYVFRKALLDTIAEELAAHRARRGALFGEIELRLTTDEAHYVDEELQAIEANNGG